jgi:predicted PurR-regulated permease PerM
MSTPVGKPEEPRPTTAQGAAEPARTSSTPLLVVLGGAAVFLYLIRPILLPFVPAGVAAYLMTPLVHWSARRTRLPRWSFAVLAFALLVAAAAALASVAVPRLIREAAQIAGDAEEILGNVIRQSIGDGSVRLFGQSVDAAALTRAATEWLRGWIAQADQVKTLVLWAFGGIFGVFLTLVLLFYFLISGPRLASSLLWLVPPRRRDLVARVWAQLDPVLKGYFVGVLIVVTYAVIAAYVGLGLILGLRHAVLLALLTGLLELIPVIGPGAAAVIAGLIALRDATGMWSIIAYAIYATILRLSIDQLLGPLVLGRAAHVHPVLVIFCFLAGGILFGIAGVILAVPVALAVKTILTTLYEKP